MQDRSSAEQLRVRAFCGIRSSTNGFSRSHRSVSLIPADVQRVSIEQIDAEVGANLAQPRA
jgi:hypothetical protein